MNDTIRVRITKHENKVYLGLPLDRDTVKNYPWFNYVVMVVMAEMKAGYDHMEALKALAVAIIVFCYGKSKTAKRQR